MDHSQVKGRHAGLTADGSRQKRAPSQAVAGSKQQDSGSSNKQAKARQSVAGVDVVSSRVAKN